MRGSWWAGVLALAIVLAGCGRGRTGSGPAGDRPADMPKAGGAGHSDVVGGSQAAPGRAGASDRPVQEQPAPVHWYIPSIGAPLRSEDPRAKGMKVVMLTFDDGPDPETTPMVLDVLRKEHVRALFFVTGYGATHEDLLRRIQDEGHLIGTHTQNHTLLTRLKGREAIRAEIAPVNEQVERVTGQRVRYFRPPNGMYNADVLAVVKELGLQLVNWSHGSQDWVPSSTHEDPGQVARYVLAEKPPAPGATALHPGAVILMHDTHLWTAQALPKIIAGLREKGYEFALLDP